jgi:membrane-associated protease RseP (regulator of RpoE activity)
MSLTGWILLILLLIYIPLWIWVWRSPKAAKYGLEKYGPCIKINTQLGKKSMDKVAKYHRFWRAMGVFSQVASFVMMAVIVYVVVVAVINLPNSLQSSTSIGIEYVLAIPGLNPLLPFWYALLALIIALVCHEFAHGVQTRTNGMRVKNTGLLYGVVPLGAFVEPEQEDVEKASRRVKLDLYCAGITTNFVIAGVAFIIMSAGMLGGLTSDYSDNAAVWQETDDSPAYDAGIPAGAIITEVNGVTFYYTDDCDEYQGTEYGWEPGQTVSVTYLTEGNEETTVTMQWGVYLTQIADDSAASEAGLEAGTFITKIETSDGTVYKFYTQEQFSDFMSTTSGGDTITVYTLAEGETDVSNTTSYEIVLDSNNGIGYLGVYLTTSGMNLITPDILLETASNPVYGADGIFETVQYSLSYLSLPFYGMDPIPESVQWWYDAGDGFWILAELLYWIFWLNLMLGICNALPAVPFDGGYIFMGWADWVLEKMGKKDAKAREEQAADITHNISVLMIFLYALVIVAVLV